ncbi:uncharacterized protein GIQ15_02780 [Arthroderma uncinatum]|uniref:uncharacterized protein n=1 Tax=Arthroderma uncinatum TaxID=74035 RepID=UPI00144AC9F8|nr:uncharacterized protein GIQ15_02780 [Arthroderma uncinatum]KAF3483456.1 hypothetical protein GIQ15_02780 [Arthroderma uncinatum]
MSSPSLPEAASLPSLPPAAHIAILNTLFEPSQHLHDLAGPLFTQQPFSSYQDLIDAVKGRLAALAGSATQPGNNDDARVLYDILGSHPRLGASRSASHLSESSRREQANLASPDDGDNEADQLRKLNAEYEEKFPGLRYVVFVNGRGRDVIMQNMRERIQRGDLKLEIQETIQAMCDIANDRASKAL